MVKPAGRILVAKVGLDGHEASAKLIALVLRDAGYEVIYLGPRRTPAEVVAVAEQEDVDVIGVSLLSGAHKHVAREILRLLRERRLEIPLILGGIIPPVDHEELTRLGVAAVFGPGARTSEIIDALRTLVGHDAADRRPV